MSELVIEVADFSYGVAGKSILNRVSFSVERGEYLGIIGPNGAGKTTLLKCLMRINVGGQGAVRIAGRPLVDCSQKELARYLSYVPQADGRLFPFTAREFVMMGRYPHLSPFSSVSSKDDKEVDEALQVTGMSDFADRAVGTLSGGERQKLFVAAAVAQGSDVILLDEPTAFLDPKHQAEIEGMLRRLNKDGGVTLVTVTHDVNSAALQCDKVLALKAGRVAHHGPAAGIMDNSVLQPVFDKEFVFATHPHRNVPVVVPDGV